MNVITKDLDGIAGGFGAYDAGVHVGQAIRAAMDLLAEMGKDYTPIL